MSLIINYEWVGSKVSDRTQLSPYCGSSKDVEFCWWLLTEVGDASHVFHKIMAVLLETSVSGEYRGDKLRLHVDGDTVSLVDPRSAENNTYDRIDFIGGMENWKTAIQLLGQAT